MTKDIRETNESFAQGMTETGVNLLILAVTFGGSAILIQWGVWFIIIGLAVYSVVSKGADIVDWGWSKVPEMPTIPFRKKKEEDN